MTALLCGMSLKFDFFIPLMSNGVKRLCMSRVWAHTFSPSTQEAATGRALSLRPPWYTESSRTHRTA